MTGAEAEDDIPLGERKTVTDFCYLLDKSKQLFNGLRSVSPIWKKHLVLVVMILLQVSVACSWFWEGFWDRVGHKLRLGNVFLHLDTVEK